MLQPRRLGLGDLCGPAALTAAVLVIAALLAPNGAYGATSDIVNIDLSGEAPGRAAAVPVIALDPKTEARVAVAWRFIVPSAKPNDNAPGDWECHLSLSADGGRSFKTQMLSWTLPLSRCNAPYVAISVHGDFYVGATLSSAMAPDPALGHRVSAAVVARSVDGGKTWSPTVGPIASGMRDRFAGADFLPPAALKTPWDGARGVVDPQTGAFYLSGAFPAPPGGNDHSQRFFSLSTDGVRTFGPIRPFAAPDWPERWDGDLVAAHGLLAMSYLGSGTPDPAVKCLCAIFAVSTDGGAMVRRSVVAAGDIGTDTIVHYPELAADTRRKGRFALVLISADRKRVSGFVTMDTGATWRSASPDQPQGVISVSRPAVAFTPKGRLIVAWRGYHADGSYDVYAAAQLAADRFGSAVLISTSSSRAPENVEKTYAVRGDFHTALAAGEHWVHLAWADARTGKDVRVEYGRAPMSLLTRSNP